MDSWVYLPIFNFMTGPILPDKIESLWTATTPSTNYPALKDKIETDVIIIGGGIAGLNAAYFLKRAGLKVVLLEATYLASGTSGNTTAKVTSLHELKYYFLKNTFGKEKAQLYADSNQWAITELEKIITREKIDCDFHKLPAYTYAKTKEDLEKVKKEFQVALELKLPASFVNSIDYFPFRILGAVRFAGQAYIHPRKFLLSLANKINGKGSYIFEKTKGLDIHEGNNLCEVTTDRGNIKSKYVIVATNFPFYDPDKLFAQLSQLRSYVLAVKLNTEIPQGIFIGPNPEYLYFRPHEIRKEIWTTIGGMDYPIVKNINDQKRYQKLAKAASMQFDILTINYRWAARDTMPHDLVPYIGYMPQSKRIFVTTGFGEWGMTTSFVSAKLLTDLILGIKNDWTDLYDPARLKPKHSKTIVITNPVTPIKSGKTISTKIKNKGGEFMDLKKNEGKVIKQKGENIAVYKDVSGEIHAVSAICTHQGCTVGWNKKDSTWDCPCHGSRYDKNGKVIHGPAVKDLPKKELDK